MLSHSTWQPASSHGNALTAEFKDSIYRAVTTQIYCSSRGWERSRWILLNWRNGNVGAKTELWSSHCGRCQSFEAIIEDCVDSKHPSETTVKMLLIRSQSEVNCTGPRTDSRICRSDYETGRWEALKLKLAQMESDACSANRHQPTAGCLKASDLWELDGYGNCCLTGFAHGPAWVCTHRFLALVTLQTLNKLSEEYPPWSKSTSVY